MCCQVHRVQGRPEASGHPRGRERDGGESSSRVSWVIFSIKVRESGRCLGLTRQPCIFYVLCVFRLLPDLAEFEEEAVLFQSLLPPEVNRRTVSSVFQNLLGKRRQHRCLQIIHHSGWSWVCYNGDTRSIRGPCGMMTHFQFAKNDQMLVWCEPTLLFSARRRESFYISV